MIRHILAFSLKNRALVFLGALALFGIGLWSATQLPIDAVPDITGVQIQVNTEVGALAPEEIERRVSQPLELALTGLQGLTEMRSLSKAGLSQLTLQFTDQTDIYRARQLVTERLQSTLDTLPKGATPMLAPISTGLGEIYYYVIDYKPDAKQKPATREAQLFELSDIHEYVVKPLLRTLPGIAEINATGGYEKEVNVQPRLRDLENIGMTIAELADIIAKNVENAGGGVFNRGEDQINIRAVTRANTLDDIAAIPLKFGAGVEPMRVRDVADVTFSAKFRTGAATLNGTEVVLGTTMMLAGENSRIVAERVKERLKNVQTKLPEGVEISPVYDRSLLVDLTIHTVEKNLIEGAALVVVVLLLLLGNWRAALIVTLVIPLSFLFAITGMTHWKISGNLMSLGAVDFGLVIDGAVVIVENIVREMGLRRRQLGRELSATERDEVVLHASTQVAHPMFFGVIIITLVYGPILALTGIEGKMFHPMAITVMLALSGSLLLSLTLMPALCSLFLRGDESEKENVLLRMMKACYEPLLRLSMAWRWALVPAAVALCWGAFLLYKKLGAEFTPKLDEGSITAMYYKKVGMSMEASIESDIKAEKALLAKVPEITGVFSRIGSSEIASDPMPVNESDVYISYQPQSEWRKIDGRPMTKSELIERIKEALKEAVPDSEVLVSQPIEMRFNELLEGIRSDIAVKVYGNDYDVLEKLAGEVKEILEKTAGAGEVEHETEGRTTNLEIASNREALARYNLQASEINHAVGSALGGETVGVLHEGNRRRDIVVRLSAATKSDIEEMKKLQLRVGEHGIIALGTVTDFKEVKAVEPINRDNGQRRAAIMVNVRGRDVESYVIDAQEQIHQKIKLPEGYTIEFGGQFENLQEARARLMVVVPATLALILILIFLAFRSIRQTLLIATGIPLALTGGVVALWLRDMPFSITAAVGFIALSGVAVLNGLVLIEYFNHLRDEGKSPHDAVIEGTLTRLRPVMMTALVASLGFVPMALATGAGAEVQRPLATVVIGGILSSTFLTLILLPVLYAWVERPKAAKTGAAV